MRYLHRAKTLPAIPGDYYERFDASTSEGMTFTTDEATGDIATWRGQMGQVTLGLDHTGTAPVRQSDGAHTGIYFNNGQVLSGAYNSNDPVDRAAQLANGGGGTTFLVCKVARADQVTTLNRFTSNGMMEHIGPRITNAQGPNFFSGAAYPGAPSAEADLDGVRMIWAVRTTHVATDDNTVELLIGDDLSSTSTSIADSMLNGPNYLCFGALSNVTDSIVGYIYEYIYYDRLLSTVEVTKVSDYLSNKWAAQAADSASTVTHVAVPHKTFGKRPDLSLDASDTPSLSVSGADVTAWRTSGRNGGFAIAPVTSNPPELATVDGYPAVRFDSANTEGMRATVPSANRNTVDSGATMFGVVRFFATPFTGGEKTLLSWRSGNACIGTAASAYGNNLYVEVVNANNRSAEDYNGIGAICAVRFNGGAAPWAADYWINGTKQPTQDEAGGSSLVVSNIGVGQVSNTDSRHADGYVHQADWFWEILSDEEVEARINELSVKWGIPLGDTPTKTLYSIQDSDWQEVWSNSNVDQQGEGATTGVPGRQAGEYSIIEIADDLAPQLDNFPLTKWGSDVRFWFDPKTLSGSTVSSWLDRTGQVTAAATASAFAIGEDKFGKYVQGNGVLNNVLQTPIINFSATSGDQRIHWCVVTAGDADADAGVCGFRGGQLGPYVEATHTGDLIAGRPHLTAYCNGLTSGLDRMPCTVEDGREKPQVIVWLETVQTSDVNIRRWASGLELPESGGVPWANNRFYIGGLGAVGGSTGKVYQAGSVDVAGGGVADSDIEDLIRWLCAKYQQPFIPDTAPLDISLHARSTEAVLLVDLPLWYRSDHNCSPERWGLHPLVAAFHTSPANFALQQRLGAMPIGTERARKMLQPPGGPNMLGASSYNMAETTDFAAVDGGASYYCIGRVNSEAASSGTLIDITNLRVSRGGVGVTQVLAGLTASNSGPFDTWFLAGGTHAFDVGGNPLTNLYYNDNTIFSSTASGVSSIGATAMCVGSQIVSSVNPGIGDVAEILVFKHPLSVATEIPNLKRYANWRYQLGLAA